jgi:hypothetical protein
MSVQPDINPSPDFINNLLSINFQCMELGDPVIRPFLQDVIQFGPQAKLLISIMLNKPLFIPQILQQVMGGKSAKGETICVETAA